VPQLLSVRLFPFLHRNGWHMSEPFELLFSGPGDQREFAVVKSDRDRVQPYPYVYIHEDGSARELYPSEREYLETPFHPADGGRPYIKWCYREKEGCPPQRGFLDRSDLPEGFPVASVEGEAPEASSDR